MTSRNKQNSQPGKPAPYVWLLAMLAWAGIMLWLSLTPSPPQIPGALGWDKLQHAGAYGLLSLLIAGFLLSLQRLDPTRAWWFAGVTAICYGGLVEVLQLLARTGRTAEWWDLVADAIGVVIACVVFRQVGIARSHRNKDAGKKHG